MEISKLDKDRIRRWRKMGWTYRDIASIVGISHPSVWRFLNKKSIWTRIYDKLLNTTRGIVKRWSKKQ